MYHFKLSERPEKMFRVGPNIYKLIFRVGKHCFAIKD